MEINFAQTYKKKAECKKQKAEGRFQNIHYIHIPFLKKPDDKLTKT
jgi:hypothetical protein